MLQRTEIRDKDGSGSTTTPATQGNDETVPLLMRERISGRICGLHSGTRWTSESWGNIFPSTRTSIPAALFITGSVVLCFVACIALFHPRMAGEFADSLRCLLFTSPKPRDWKVFLHSFVFAQCTIAKLQVPGYLICWWVDRLYK